MARKRMTARKRALKNPTLKPFGVSKKIVKSTMKKSKPVTKPTPVKTKTKVKDKVTASTKPKPKKTYGRGILKEAYGKGGLQRIRQNPTGAGLTLAEAASSVVSLPVAVGIGAAYKFRKPIMQAIKVKRAWNPKTGRTIKKRTSRKGKGKGKEKTSVRKRVVEKAKKGASWVKDKAKGAATGVRKRITRKKDPYPKKL